jgi:hypothetical protein
MVDDLAKHCITNKKKEVWVAMDREFKVVHFPSSSSYAAT